MSNNSNTKWSEKMEQNFGGVITKTFEKPRYQVIVPSMLVQFSTDTAMEAEILSEAIAYASERGFTVKNTSAMKLAASND